MQCVNFSNRSIVLQFVGTWDTTYDSGIKTTYVIAKNGGVEVPYCTWTCSVTSSSIGESDNKKYPPVEGWYKISGIHSDSVDVYLRVKGLLLEVSYVSSNTYSGIGVRRQVIGECINK